MSLDLREIPVVDPARVVGYASHMAVPDELLQQLLALDKPVRLEIAHALLDSVEGEDDGDGDGMSDAERAKLHAALQRSIEQCERGETVPADEVFRELRAKRAARTAR